MGGLRRKFMENSLITTNYRSSEIRDDKKKSNVKEWISFF